jgi:ferric-dicitrate binding protein FerR (iron transport regulator)
MRILFILALVALVFSAALKRYPRNLTSRRALFQTVTSVTKTFRMLQDDEFPEWNTDEIEGWDDMTPEEQKEVKDMYDSLKELYDALNELAEALDDIPDERRRRQLRAVKRKPTRRLASVVSRRM